MDADLTTTDSVIDALGGTSAFAQLLGCKMTRVSNWRVQNAGTFPPDTFEPITAALAKIGKRAKISLWPVIPTTVLLGVSVCDAALAEQQARRVVARPGRPRRPRLGIPAGNARALVGA